MMSKVVTLYSGQGGSVGVCGSLAGASAQKNNTSGADNNSDSMFRNKDYYGNKDRQPL